MDILSKELTDLKEKSLKLKGIQELRKKQLKQAEEEWAAMSEKLSMVKEASSIVQKAISDTTSSFQIKISPVIDSTLSAVFGDRYKFEVKYGTRGKKTKTSEIYFELSKDGTVLDGDITQEVGGGVVNLIALGLRASVLMLSKNDKILVVDEALANLKGKDYIEKAAQLLSVISKRLGVQLVFITHEPEVMEYADNVIQI